MYADNDNRGAGIMKYDKGDKVKINGVIREIENITQWDKDSKRYKFVGVSGWHEIKEEQTNDHNRAN